MKWFDDDGEPTPEPERDLEAEMEAAEEGQPFLLSAKEEAVHAFVRSRWERLEEEARKKAAQVKVNYMRYSGIPWVTVNPRNPNQVYFPGGQGKRQPILNKIKRTVHRYVAQVTADEPVIEAVPQMFNAEGRDAAEAATHALRGEWERLGLHSKLQEAASWGAIVRSGFWLFEWDDHANTQIPAQKYFKDEETGEDELEYVDSSGKKVGSSHEAAMIRVGDLCVEVGTPFNCRWDGGHGVHEAKEVMWAKMPTLRMVYESFPDLRKKKVSDLLAEVPMDGHKFLEDFRATTYEGTTTRDIDEDLVNETTGDMLDDDDSLLDERVFLLNYFVPKGATYKDGAHVILVGNVVTHRSKLAWGVIPVAQFRCLNDPADGLGESLVDLLKDPQELLDFVNSQILRFLQMLRRRWFVPQGSLVKPSDLLAPTQSIVEYNPAAGEPKPENTPEVPNSLVTWVQSFKEDFNDEAGIHDIMQGKHVPGVQSGRHAEALRSGDETLLGLTRQQLREGLEHSGLVILEAIKKEWTQARKVRYFGEARSYVEKSFTGTDFGSSASVHLKRGTLLMYSPAQQLEALYGYFQMGVLTEDELREAAPLADTSGFSLSQDSHQIRARSQNATFLSGPPKELYAQRRIYDARMLALETAMLELRAKQLDADAAGTPIDLTADTMAIQQKLDEAGGQWEAELAKFAPKHEPWEDDATISRIHAEAHSRALADPRVEDFPPWWVEKFSTHTRDEWELGNPEQVQVQLQTQQLKMQLEAPQAVGGGQAPQ
jgi:hypothetical protein